MGMTEYIGDGHSAATDAERLHQDATIIDLVSPLMASVFPRGIEDYLAGSVTVIGATVIPRVGSIPQNASDALYGIALLRRLVRSRPEQLLLVETVEDIQRAKETSRLGVFLHFQGCAPFEREVGFVELFYRLGVRVALLAYNVTNQVADGCTERTDAGLSKFGVRAVQEMHRVGMVVDGSHSGRRATLQAMDLSDRPFIFSHSNCKAVYDHARNLTDEQIRACAHTGGVIGVAALPYFVSASRQPALDHLLRHVAYIADLVGVDHVALGMDYFWGIGPYATPEEQERWDQADAEDDVWNPRDLPRGPWTCAPGIETPAGMLRLTDALLRHGFSDAEVRKILGENALRVFRAAWKPVANESDQ